MGKCFFSLAKGSIHSVKDRPWPYVNMFLKYGKDTVRFNLDSAWVARELSIKDYPPLENPPLAIREAIRKPIQSPPFKRNRKTGAKGCFPGQ